MEKIKKFWSRYSYLVFITFVILGLFDSRFAIAAIVCMLAPILFSVFGKGRYWCGNLCPRGNFYDIVLSKFSNKNKTPNLLKSKYFRTIVIIIMFTVFGNQSYKNWGNATGIGLLFYRMIVITSLVGIVLSFFYNSRVWCNFCPMGSISAFISKFKKDKKVLNIDNNCVNCKVCEKKCPMGISPYEYNNEGKISNIDCIQCKKCAFVCPKGSIN
ncbi:4Fe-4S binding protein [Clostridium tetani]|nr:4Fe-4S binding protein [Clostridium tetani]